MTPTDLQKLLLAEGFDIGPSGADGDFGDLSRKAMAAALTGNPAPLTATDVAAAATQLGTTPATVWAVCDVESAGRGFHPISRLPIILYEPHVFHRETGGCYSGSHREISYPSWGDRPYPKTQAERWAQMFAACALDPGAALRSASWGLFQIMGFNRAACGFNSVWDFAKAHGHSERAQLLAFASYVEHAGLADELREHRWADFARRYNGPSFANNMYDSRLKAAFARRAA
jgi:hypothetical protein